MGFLLSLSHSGSMNVYNLCTNYMLSSLCFDSLHTNYTEMHPLSALYSIKSIALHLLHVLLIEFITKYQKAYDDCKHLN